jgi:glutamyl-tRNA synthetase
MEQMCSWFDMTHLSGSASQFNPEKLDWVNNHYIKAADNARLADLIRPRMLAAGAQFDGAPDLAQVIALLKDRTNTLVELADAAMLFYRTPAAEAELLNQHLTDAIKPALAAYVEALRTVDGIRRQFQLQ